MPDIRKNVKVHPVLKDDLQALKKELKLSSESEVICWLLELEKCKMNSVTVPEMRSMLHAVETIHKQSLLL